jgi:glutamate--cysteine ligase
MTAHRTTALMKPAPDLIDRSRAHIAAHALKPSVIGDVGLELEYHVVDRRRPGNRLAWDELTALVAQLPQLPEDSRVTVEPGGQLELSTPPRRGVVAAITALQRDERALTDAVASAGLGLAPIGTDLARPVQRVNPAGRYVAMERHFDALGYGPSGRAMMASTAALQVNVNAGPEHAWPDRLNRIHRLGPVLVALSACSPLLAGRSSGWHSMRQQAWLGIDEARCRPLPAARNPVDAWVSYAMSAPVMLVRDPQAGTAEPVLHRAAFSEWAGGSARLGRAPTIDDLDYHLSTLFPPVRPRGYLEIRCLDAVPKRWWPALAALTVTLIDDELAADRAAELCEPVADAWSSAASDGLRNPAVLAAARGCADLAAQRCPVDLRPEVEAYAEMVARGRTPGDHLRERAAASSPLAVLEEETHA